MNEREIFEAAMGFSSIEQRADFLAQACAGDSDMQTRLVELLDAERRLGSFLEIPAVGVGNLDDTVGQDLFTQECDQIGAYKLLQQIGEGGMGTVWMAEQHEPVRRRVALKLIKPGMDSRQVLARFEAERQALSLMDHPNIAKVLDAGVVKAGDRRREAGGNEAGGGRPEAADLSSKVQNSAHSLQPSTRPYFVMELVKGQPITEYCDQHRLNTRERLELFLPVCHAIQHAHQKGIIHRDIKPSNVLVAEYDGRPVAKVIDFGVAKALHQPLTEKTMFTGLGQIIGTLEYMSPEQARVNQLDIDTRSDVYSLGVLLYELLTGSTPFDRKRLREAALEELLRIIRDEEPPRPSTKLNSSQTLPEIAADRSTEPARLSTLIRGELDWIVMKALEKDRNRRYESASGFAMDIQRYLNDEPVLACPPSASYRFRKFARKNRTALIAGVLVGVTLCLGLATTSWQALRARRAELAAIAERDQKDAARVEALELASQAHQATQAEREARQEEAKQRELAEKSAIAARRESEISEAINQFVLQDLLALTDSAMQVELGLNPQSDVPMRDLLERGAHLLDDRFSGKPHIREPIRIMIAKAYAALGMRQKAFEQWEQAWLNAKKLLEPDDPSLLATMNGLGVAASHLGRIEMAEELFTSALDQGTSQLGPTHPESLGALLNLAALYRKQKRLSEAEPLFRKGQALFDEAYGRDHRETLIFTNSLGMFYLDSGQISAAHSLYVELIPRMQRVLGDQHPFTLVAMNNMGGCCGALGRWDEEQHWLEQSVPEIRKLMGEDHPYYLISLKNLAVALMRHENGFQRALPLVESLANYQRKLQETGEISAAELAATLYAQTTCQLGLEQWSRAEDISREAIALFETSAPEDYRRYLTISMLGEALQRQGNVQEASQCLRDGYVGIKNLRDRLPPQAKPRAMQALERLIRMAEAEGDAQQASIWQAERKLWN